MGILTNKEIERQRQERLGEIWVNNDGYEMKIIEYINSKNVLVEFLDDKHFQKRTNYNLIKRGEINNVLQPSAFNIGVIGDECPTRENGKLIKEYYSWYNMLRRCYNTPQNSRNMSYNNCTVCEKWIYYPNFYKWLHSQENFDKWLNCDLWGIDKDIIIKNNKIYSPDTCCLVPEIVNTIFTKTKVKRGVTPIGVSYHKRDNIYEAHCSNPYLPRNNCTIYLGRFNNQYDAFLAYKEYKEKIIKQVAQEEFNKSNITKKCYDAMMNYEVEITD